MWSRPPNASPISGKLCWVSSFASAIATCEPGHRSVASFGHEVSHFYFVIFRDLAFDVIQKTCLSCSASKSFKLSLISSMSNGLPVKLALAITLLTHPPAPEHSIEYAAR